MLVRFLSTLVIVSMASMMTTTEATVSAFVPRQHHNDGWSAWSRRRSLRPRTTVTTTVPATGPVCLFAVTPIGPFCVFRSPASVVLDPHMDFLAQTAPSYAAEIERGNQLAEALQAAGDSAAAAAVRPPDREKLLRVGRLMDESVDFWLTVHAQWRLSPDFQLREFGKLTEARLARYGETVESMAATMRWNAEGMRAVAKGLPPPVPRPQDYERFQKLAQLQEQNQMDATKPTISGMAPGERITASPFDSEKAAAVLESPTVRQELEQLKTDHESLILLGGSYGDFDSVGKVIFIDEIEKVEDRWDIFFARFRLLGLLNKEYVRQCNDFLNAAGLNEEDFRKLLKEAHDLMRLEAENE